MSFRQTKLLDVYSRLGLVRGWLFRDSQIIAQSFRMLDAARRRWGFDHPPDGNGARVAARQMNARSPTAISAA
jgi:hypothetical protein